MSFSLTFSPEFFLAGGEPYDSNREPTTRPTSVWQAIETMRVFRQAQWADMARGVFKCESRFLTPEAVLERIQETNTCTDLSSPVEVWVDSDGYYTVLVWDVVR
jgi:hypothetical protein